MPMIRHALQREVAYGTIGAGPKERNQRCDLQSFSRARPYPNQSIDHEIHEGGMLVVVRSRQTDQRLAGVRVVILLDVRLASRRQMLSGVLPKQTQVVAGIDDSLVIV